MSSDLSSRIENAANFASGKHPLMKAAFYPGKQSDRSEPISQFFRTPIQTVPPELFSALENGNNATAANVDAHDGTGEPIEFQNGFIARIPVEERKVQVFFDTDSDNFLAGTIDRAGRLFERHPEWTASKKMFEIGLLCFGNWNLKRHPLQDFASETFYLGELVSTMDIGDFSCAVFGFACHVVARSTGLPVTFHTGVAAKFSTFTQGIGDHGWGILNEPEPRMIDWTNYPDKIRHLFAKTRTTKSEDLWDEFLKTYGNFPVIVQPRISPTVEEYYDFIAGHKPGFGLRNSTAYFTYNDTYLYSAALPLGWSQD